MILMRRDLIIGRPLTKDEVDGFYALRKKADAERYVLEMCRKEYGYKPHLPGDFAWLPSVTKEQLRKLTHNMPTTSFYGSEYPVFERVLVTGQRASIDKALSGFHRFADYSRLKAALAVFVEHIRENRFNRGYADELDRALFNPECDLPDSKGKCEFKPVPEKASPPKIGYDPDPNWNRGPAPPIKTGDLDLRVSPFNKIGPPPKKPFHLTPDEFEALSYQVHPNLHRPDAEVGAYKKTVEGLTWPEILLLGLNVEAAQLFVHELVRIREIDDRDALRGLE